MDSKACWQECDCNGGSNDIETLESQVTLGQYYTLVEQKAILLIFISIIDKNINFRLKWNWRKGQFELIKMSIDSSLYSCILYLYLEVEKISVDHNLNWQIDKKVNLRLLKYQSTPLYIVA